MRLNYSKLKHGIISEPPTHPKKQKKYSRKESVFNGITHTRSDKWFRTNKKVKMNSYMRLYAMWEPKENLSIMTCYVF